MQLTNSKKVTDKGMQEALAVAQKAQEIEEENLMKQAIEESLRQQITVKSSEQEEMDMIQQAIALSKAEEDARQMKDHESKLTEQQQKFQTDMDSKTK